MSNNNSAKWEVIESLLGILTGEKIEKEAIAEELKDVK
jgi:hypothetical protein